MELGQVQNFLYGGQDDRPVRFLRLTQRCRSPGPVVLLMATPLGLGPELLRSLCRWKDAEAGRFRLVDPSTSRGEAGRRLAL